MKRLQQFSWISAILIVLIGTALADGIKVAFGTKAQPERVDLAVVPPECKQFLQVPADSTSDTLPWDQRLSLAACRQSLVLEPTSNPTEYRGLIERIDRAMAPSIAMYEDARARGPTPQIRILAAYGLGMTHGNSMVRARSAVRVAETGAAFGGDTYGMGADAYERIHQSLEPLLVPHRDAAVAAFRDVARLAKENPAAARANPVMIYVVADAERQASLLQPETEGAPTVSKR